VRTSLRCQSVLGHHFRDMLSITAITKTNVHYTFVGIGVINSSSQHNIRIYKVLFDSGGWGPAVSLSMVRCQ